MEKKNRFSQSLQEMKKVPVIAACAMFAALGFILESVAIDLGPYIKIGFSQSAGGSAVWSYHRNALRRSSGCVQIFHSSFRALLLWLYFQCHAGRLHLWMVLLQKASDPWTGAGGKGHCGADRQCIFEYVMAGYAVRKRVPGNPACSGFEESDYVAH